MCDYSLMAMVNRLAEEGETLYFYRFSSGCLGLTGNKDLKQWREKVREIDLKNNSLIGLFKGMFLLSPPPPRDPKAVCIVFGAQLEIFNIPARMQSYYNFQSSEIVEFTQLDVKANHFRDAVIFRKGAKDECKILLQEFNESTNVKVLNLSPVKGEVAKLSSETVLK